MVSALSNSLGDSLGDSLSQPASASDAGRAVLVCPDKFRGSFSAAEVAQTIVGRLAHHGIPADTCPVADGGEGTLAIVARALDHELVEVEACDALERPLRVPVALLDGGRTALIESATAIGWEPLAATAPDPWDSTSRGIGLAIVACAELGVREVLVAIGGTVTTDGGAGALAALTSAGWSPDRDQRRAGNLPKLTALCDARVAWEQAATMFAPQKGADVKTVAKLLNRLEQYAAQLPRDPRSQVMSGAGGGLAGGLWAGADAELRGGGAWVLDRVDFGRRMLASRAVITGEGRIDRQTLLGKAVAEAATRARQAGVPCHAIVGTNAISEFDARILDFESVHAAGDRAAIASAVDAIVPQLATR